MKKTLLAAALTVGFFGVAQAETSVTLYGIIDTGVGYQKVEGFDGAKIGSNPGANPESVDAKKFGLINGVQSGSRWGLKGAEDLGDGLRAVFQLESGYDSSTGSSAQGGRLFGRQATIGLASDSWGRLDLGRQTNLASQYFAGVGSPFGAGFGQAAIGSTFSSASTVRWDNTIMYQTPNFSGFQFGVGYSFNADGSQDFKVDGQDSNTKGITTALRYENGPIAAALSYDQLKRDALSADYTEVKQYDANGNALTSVYSQSQAARDEGKIKAWNLGASYDFEVVKLHAAFGQTRDGLINAGSYGDLKGGNVFIDDLKANLYTVGLSAPVGAAGKVMASWGMADFKDFTDSKNVEHDMEKQQSYNLGYTYSLSKRTNVYVIGSYIKNLYGIDGTKSTLAGVGLRHQF